MVLLSSGGLVIACNTPIKMFVILFFSSGTIIMLDHILAISHNIIIIGGAACVLVAVGTMIYAVIVMNKLHRLMSDIKQKYEFISNVVISPFRILQRMFEE